MLQQFNRKGANNMEQQVIKAESISITSFDLNKLITTSRLFSKIKLSPSAKLVLRCLIDFWNHKTGVAFPKQSTISQATGLTKASVNKAVDELRTKKADFND